MLCCTMICRHWYGASMHAERLCLGRNHGGNDVTVRACHAVVADTHADSCQDLYTYNYFECFYCRRLLLGPS